MTDEISHSGFSNKLSIHYLPSSSMQKNIAITLWLQNAILICHVTHILSNRVWFLINLNISVSSKNTKLYRNLMPKTENRRQLIRFAALPWKRHKTLKSEIDSSLELFTSGLKFANCAITYLSARKNHWNQSVPPNLCISEGEFGEGIKDTPSVEHCGTLHPMRFSWRFRGTFHSNRRNPKLDSSESTTRNRSRRRRGQLRYLIGQDESVLSWDDFITDENCFEHLNSEAKLLWTMHGGDRGEAKSFWISRSGTAKCFLELFAQRVASFHCSRAGGESTLYFHLHQLYWTEWTHSPPRWLLQSLIR